MASDSEFAPTWTTDPNVATKIQMGSEGIAAMPSMTIPELLKKTAAEFPQHPALVYEDAEHTWKTVTYSQYQAKVEHTARAFIKLGLKPRHSVGVLALNSPEWFYTELGAIQAGGIIAGIYTTNSAEATYHVLDVSRANICVVDDEKQMEKVHSIRHKLPELKAIVQIQAPYAEYVNGEKGYYRWSDLAELDVSDVDKEYQTRLQNIRVNEAAVLIFTSGTTGMPKGVMLNHDNIMFTNKQIETHISVQDKAKNTLISYLPMSHVAAQCLDLFYGLYGACAVYFADRNALKSGLINTLRVSRPTQFGAVPRVFEKIRDGLVENEEKQSKLVKRLISWARNAALAYHKDLSVGSPSCYRRLQFFLARLVVLNEIKFKLGLDRCLDIISGAAPISRELKMFFMSYDLPIVETYGMSESTGPCTMFESRNWDSVGKALEGTEITVRDPDSNGHGELCMRGRHIFMGYIGDEEKTKEALGDDGRLRSGDIGYVDEKGFVYITGRMKELIITAGGENIPPVHVEQLVKSELPCVSNAFLVGDHRKYLVMLITLKTQMNPETGAPLDDLHFETLDFVKSLGLEYKTLSEIIKAGPCPKVKKAIEEGIKRSNKHAISKAQHVQKFELLDHDFSVPTGELGPTLKIKRSVVVNMYANVIEKMYQ